MEKKRINKKEKDKIFWSIVIIILIITTVFGFFVDPKLVIIILLPTLLITTYIFYRKEYGNIILKETSVSLLISLALVSYFSYEYTTNNFMVGGLNLFPLVAWTFGLVLVKQVYNTPKKHKFLIATTIYIVGLFLIEIIGYYGMNIQLNSNHTSMLGLGIIHAPLTQKIAYLTIGPVYLAITKVLKIP